MDEVLATHPRIGAAARALEAARHEVVEARASFYPTVTVFGDVGPEYIDTPSSRRLRGALGRSDLFRRTAGVAVTQRLFAGNRNAAELAAARINKRLAELNLRFTTQDVVHGACLAFLDVLRQTRLLALATENLRVVQAQTGLEDARSELGSGMAVDVLLAVTRLDQARERVVAIEGALEDARARYQRFFGRAPDADGMVRPELARSSLPGTLGEARRIAQEANVDLLIAAEEVRVAEQYRRSAAAARWPVVDLVGAVGYEEDLASLPGQGDDYSVLLTMTWDVFAGFRTRSKVSALRAKRERARLEAADVARRVASEVARAFGQLETGVRRVALLEHASEAAEELFEARRQMRASGNETAINVLDARSEIFRARMKLTDADFDLDAALLRLALATGRLEPAFVGAPPAAADGRP